MGIQIVGSTDTVTTTTSGGTVKVTPASINATGVSTFSGGIVVGTGASINSPATNVLTLGTNNTESVRIDSSGNLGIGTTGTSDKLTVLGAIQIQQNSGSSNRIILRGQPNSSYRWNIDNNASTNHLRFFREDDATAANGAVYASITSTGDFQFNSGYGSAATAYGCRAWVNFNGTGSTGTNQTIRGSGNVSSVGKNADGNYTVNFTSAMPDANYSVSGFASNNDDGGAESFTVSRNTSHTFSTTACQITSSENTGGSTLRIDSPVICVQFFR